MLYIIFIPIHWFLLIFTTFFRNYVFKQCKCLVISEDQSVKISLTVFSLLQMTKSIMNDILMWQISFSTSFAFLFKEAFQIWINFHVRINLMNDSWHLFCLLRCWHALLAVLTRVVVVNAEYVREAFPFRFVPDWRNLLSLNRFDVVLERIMTLSVALIVLS